jgi:hypothetical protein
MKATIQVILPFVGKKSRETIITDYAPLAQVKAELSSQIAFFEDEAKRQFPGQSGAVLVLPMYETLGELTIIENDTFHPELRDFIVEILGRS